MKTIANLGYIFLFFLAPIVCAQNYKDSIAIELQKHFKKSKLPGFSVSVVSKNGVLFQKGFGFADKQSKTLFSVNTVENLGSVSKTFVGLALVKAIEDKKLSMDSEINQFLPFTVVNPYHRDIPILVKHLATHTSTIVDSKHYGKSYIDAAITSSHKNIHKEYLSFIQSHKTYTLTEFTANILTKNGEWFKFKGSTWNSEKIRKPQHCFDGISN